LRAAPHAAREWGAKRSGDSQAAGAPFFVSVKFPVLALFNLLLGVFLDSFGLSQTESKVAHGLSEALAMTQAGEQNVCREAGILV
jgi:hypothetical protein